MGSLTPKRATLLAALAALALTLGAIPAPFSVDELHYSAVALQVANGGAEVPGLEGLPPSSELAVFRPGRMGLPDTLDRVSPTAPPLYGVIAWPFLWMGWRGLVLLNVLAFLGTLALVAQGAWTLNPRRGPGAAKLAVMTLLAGGFLLEYAPAVWPHALSVFLVTGAVVAAMESRLTGRVWLAALAGALIALAAGVRFQNAILLGLLGLSMLLGAGGWGGRLRRAVAFGLGAAPWVALSSWLNHARSGIWHPFAKSAGYVRLNLATSDAALSPQSPIDRVVEILRTFTVRVVDYGAHPPLEGAFEWKSHFLKLSDAGVMTTHNLGWEGPIRKALLQSSPWALAALVLAVMAVRHLRDGDGDGERNNNGDGDGDGDDDDGDDDNRRGRDGEMALLGLFVVANVGVFSLAGLQRDPGLCFNARYLHEIVPWLAMVVGAQAAALPWTDRVVRKGFAFGAAALLLGFALPPHLRDAWLAKAPLLLALATALAVARPSLARPAIQAALLAACLGWSAASQGAVDLPASLDLRVRRATLASAVDPQLPDDAVLLAPLWIIDGLGPAMLRGVTLASPSLDGGKAAPEIVRRALAAGRPVYVVPWGPPALYQDLQREFVVASRVDLGIDREPVLLLELRQASGSP